jgi:hypothetical protein
MSLRLTNPNIDRDFAEACEFCPYLILSWVPNQRRTNNLVTWLILVAHLPFLIAEAQRRIIGRIRSSGAQEGKWLLSPQ